MSQILSEAKFSRDSKFGLFSMSHGDPLGSTISRFAIRSPRLAVIVSSLLSLSAIVFTTAEGSFVNENLRLDLIHDIGWWNQFFLALPTLLYIAGNYFGSFPKTLRLLSDEGVILASEEQWKQVRTLVRTKLSNPSFVLLPYVCGGSAALLTSTVLQVNGAWFSNEDYIAGWLIPPFAFLLYFFMTFLALRLYTAFLILRKLFSFKVNIQPFHSDGCGGLDSLKRQSLNLSRGMTVFGVVAGLGVLSNHLVYGQELVSVYNFFIVFAYVLLTGIAFFLPLYALSFSMQTAKQKLIETINERHQNLEEARRSDSSRNDFRDDLDALEELRKTARAMQVWPFDRASLIKFFIAILSPIFLVAAVMALLQLL